jgi:hypothetical protein
MVLVYINGKKRAKVFKSPGLTPEKELKLFNS